MRHHFLSIFSFGALFRDESGTLDGMTQHEPDDAGTRRDQRQRCILPLHLLSVFEVIGIKFPNSHHHYRHISSVSDIQAFPPVHWQKEQEKTASRPQMHQHTYNIHKTGRAQAQNFGSVIWSTSFLTSLRLERMLWQQCPHLLHIFT
jgi:hypothetical protein